MTEALRRLGYFVELRRGPGDGPSLLNSVQASAHPEETQVVAYLKRGSLLATTGQLVRDILADDDAPVAMLATLTDGVWVWPADLAYYVETYHIRLPKEFLEHAARSDWMPMPLTDDQLEDAVDRLRR